MSHPDLLAQLLRNGLPTAARELRPAHVPVVTGAVQTRDDEQRAECPHLFRWFTFFGACVRCGAVRSVDERLGIGRR